MEDWRWPDFIAGLDAGLLALVPGLAAGWSWRRAVGSPAPVWAVLLALAYSVASGWTGYGSPLSPEALSVLAVAVFLTGGAPRQRILAAVGGVVMAAALPWPSLPGRTMQALQIAVPLIAVLIVDLERRPGLGRISPLLVAISCGGVYLAVPDTEHAFVLAGVATPLALLVIPSAPCRLGGVGAAAVAALLAWTVGVGSAGRSEALIGGLACAGLFLVAPVGGMLRARGLVGARPLEIPHPLHRPPTSTATVTLHGLLALGAARVVSTRSGPAMALVSAGAILGVGALLAAWALPGVAATDAADSVRRRSRP